MKDILCLIQDTKNIFGSSLSCRKWKDIVGRREYELFKRNATKILTLAYESNLFCPDIILEHDVMKIRFTNDDRYVIFFLNKYDDIDFSIGTVNGERRDYKWTKNSSMERLGNFLNE